MNVGTISGRINWSQTLSVLAIGGVVGVLVVVVQISFAALIFSGELSHYLPRGIGVCLAGAFIIGLALGIWSSLSGMVALPQDTPAAIVAAISASVFATIPASLSVEGAFFTTVALIALSSLLAGVFFLLLGFFKQGNIVRYIPYPVVGGFLAGTGWLLVVGSFSVMTDGSLSLASLPALFGIESLIRWVPGLVFAVCLLVCLRRFSHFLLLPGFLVGGLALFYLVFAITGVSLSEASEEGILLGPFASQETWRPLGISELSMVDWRIVLSQSASVATIIVVATVSLLLNASSMEIVSESDIDLDRELRVCGFGNLAMGLAGTGPAGYHALSLSALTYKTGLPSRLVCLVAAFICLGALLGGLQLIAYFPRAILGGLIMFLGLSFLMEWLVDSWRKLSRANYLIVVLILVAMGAIGVLEGVGIGFIAAVFLFIADYSRVGAIRREYSGASFRSNVERPRVMIDFLNENGDQIRVIQLQGFLFFGSVNRVVEHISGILSTENTPPVRWIILDFKRVSGMDASSVFAFCKLLGILRKQECQAIICELSSGLECEFQLQEFAQEQGKLWRFEKDIDHSLEWCEDQLLKGFVTISGMSDSQKSLNIVSSEVNELEFKSGQVLIEQGNSPSGVYLVKIGRVAVQRTTETGESIRLGVKGAGSVFGELGLYTGADASASVIAISDCMVLHLSRDAIQRIEADQPTKAIAFHRSIARQISMRLNQTNKMVEALAE